MKRKGLNVVGKILLSTMIPITVIMVLVFLQMTAIECGNERTRNIGRGNAKEVREKVV